MMSSLHQWSKLPSLSNWRPEIIVKTHLLSNDSSMACGCQVSFDFEDEITNLVDQEIE